VRLNTIRSKIVAFALLATLLPSISMGWLSYRNNLKVLKEKITEELTSVTSSTSRELDLWLKERIYDVKVFASSYEVSENLVRVSGVRGGGAGKSAALGRLKDYLKSVEQRFTDYEELAVLDLGGSVVASSEEDAVAPHLPDDWLQHAEAGNTVVGEAHRHDAGSAAAMVLAEPVRGAQERLLGLLAAKLNFEGVRKILKSQARGGAGQLYVITRSGMILTSFPPLDEGPTAADLTPDPVRDLFSREVLPLEYAGIRGGDVVGALETMRRLDWGVVAEKPKAAEYAEIARLRNVTLLMVAAILLGIALAAYVLGLTFVVPLDRLTRGAAKVAGGSLAVDLPVHSRGEVGYLTVVFNRMVARLRKAREELDATNQALIEKNEELHELSITDGLTGLHNRKHMNETVVSEVSRAARHQHPLSILMIDIDLFKTFNDARGHQAGDEVLRGVSRVLKETIRSTDYAARYGGEEFLVLLPYSASDVAMQTAERIRSQIEEAKLGVNADGRGITVSVGAASFPECGNDSDSVIREADLALYKAKRGGRNRAVQAGEAWTEPKPKKKKRGSKPAKPTDG
jgi:diguanylate cyclase (GGDEF)-like protein